MTSMKMGAMMAAAVAIVAVLWAAVCVVDLWGREAMRHREMKTDRADGGSKDSGVILENNNSGSGGSENGWISYGFSSLRGKRASMEDYFATNISQVDGRIVGLFGVFDGHGGSRAAEYLKDRLFDNLVKHPKFFQDTKRAIMETYKQTELEFLGAEHSNAGSTASTAILIAGRLLVANVGDSRAVVCRSGKAVALSKDHKPNRGDERRRIEKAGGFVMWSGVWRVGGILAVSRAFGDRLLKPYVIAEPEIQEEKVTEDVEFLVLASDGLWDVLSNQDAVSMVQAIDDAQEAATKLTFEAYRRGSADNITCVILRFHHGGKRAK